MKGEQKNLAMYGAVVVVVIGVLAAGILFFSPPSAGNAVNSVNTNQRILNTVNTDQGTDAFDPILSGTTSPGDVAIELKPLEFKDGTLRVSFSANTHSVDLSQFNLAKIVTLEYNNKEIVPTSAPQLGGHHVSGVLVFPIEEDISDFTITIKDIPKKEARTFSW